MVSPERSYIGFLPGARFKRVLSGYQRLCDAFVTIVMLRVLGDKWIIDMKGLFFITYNLTNDIMKIDGHQTRTQRNIIRIKGPKKGHIGAADYHRKPTNSS